MTKSPNPLEFEAHLRRKQGTNPDFQFLQMGFPGNDYFEGKKQEMGLIFYPPHGPPGHEMAMPGPEQVPFPPLPTDTRELKEAEVEKISTYVKDLNGTKEAIKAMSKWLLEHSDQICSVMKHLTQVIQNIDFNNFGKKLHICYVINDVLHEAMKGRDPVARANGILDKTSIGILHHLPTILQSSFAGYSPQDQDKMHNLLTLWCDRHIFSQEYINGIGNAMIAPTNMEGWNMYGYNMHVAPPCNLLHLSPGFVVDIVNTLLREQEFQPYSPIPLTQVPPCMPEKIPKTQNYILDKYDDFQRALEIIDSKHRRRGGRGRSRSRSRSGSSSYDRSPRRDYRRSKRRRFSRSSTRSRSSSRD